MEGAAAGHTPWEICPFWGATAAADVVGRGGGDRDALGGCAVGKDREGTRQGVRETKGLAVVGEQGGVGVARTEAAMGRTQKGHREGHSTSAWGPGRRGGHRQSRRTRLTL